MSKGVPKFKIYADLIKELMWQKNISMSDMSKDLGYKSTKSLQIFIDDESMPLDSLVYISKALDVSVYDLVNFNDYQTVCLWHTYFTVLEPAFHEYRSKMLKRVEMYGYKMN